MRTQRLLLLVTTAALAACTVGPDYRRPDDPAPAGFADAGSESAVVAPDAWWLSFDDPVLTSLIERATRGNLDVAQAVARVREARAEAGVSAAAGLPTLDASGSAIRSRSSENGQIPLNRIPGADIINSTYKAGFDASWEIDLFGHVRRSVEAAQARLDSAQASAAGGLLSVAAEVASDYVDLRLAQTRLVVIDDDIVIAAETRRLTALRRDAGDAADLDVQRADNALANARAQRPTVLADARAAQHKLELLVGEQPGALDALLTDPRALPAIAGGLPVDLPSTVLRRRPDVAQAERELAASNADVGVAVAERFPRFSLTGAFGQESTGQHNLLAAASRTWSLGPSVSVPIFEGGRLKHQQEAREAQRDAALAAYRAAVLQALSDTETALLRDRRERERGIELVQARTSADIALLQMQRRYDAGDVALTDVLDAQRSRNDAHDAELQSLANACRNRVSLYKALGGGWTTLQQLAAAPRATPISDAIPSSASR